MISSRDVDMEARPYRYAAPVGTILTDRGTIRPFFGCNVIVRSPNNEPIYASCTWEEIQNGWGQQEEDKIPQPIKAGILSIFSTDQGCESEIWIKCRDGEGREFECPWAWAECERSEQ